jgi:hypothetical protein
MRPLRCSVSGLHIGVTHAPETLGSNKFVGMGPGPEWS